MLSSLYFFAYDNRDFRLQPDDIHFLTPIAGGQVLEMDCYPLRVRFGVY